MGKFIEDKKNKNQDLSINLVSCGKSFDEPSGNDQGQGRNVPLEGDLGLKIYVSPRNNAQSQGHIVVTGTENNMQPTTNVPPEEENIEQQGQELDESAGNSQELEQEQEENNEDDDIGTLPKGARAKVSRPPGKRPAPKPGTG